MNYTIMALVYLTGVAVCLAFFITAILLSDRKTTIPKDTLFTTIVLLSAVWPLAIAAFIHFCFREKKPHA